MTKYRQKFWFHNIFFRYISDDISQFLKSWFRSFSERLQASRDKADLDFSRSKRDTVELKVNATSTNETSFEDYERMYLKNRTLNYIKQFYFYSKFRESSISNNSSTTSQTDSNAASINSPTALPNASTTTEEVRTDAVLEQLMEEVAEATLSELIEGLKDIKDVAERGLMDTDISSLCCPLGWEWKGFLLAII